MNDLIMVVPLLLLTLLTFIVVRLIRKQQKKRVYKCPSCQSLYKPGKRWCPSCHTSLPVVQFAFQQPEWQPIYSRASRRSIPIFFSPPLAQEASSTPLSEATTQRVLPILHPPYQPGHTLRYQDLEITLPAPQTLYQEAHQVTKQQGTCPQCHASVEAKSIFCGICGKHLFQNT
jgi:RNA polymerase subunit RPABC4/transcription elongation factor Spt4